MSALSGILKSVMGGRRRGAAPGAGRRTVGGPAGGRRGAGRPAAGGAAGSKDAMIGRQVRKFLKR